MLSGKYLQLAGCWIRWFRGMFELNGVQNLQDRERELVEGARVSRGESGVHSGSQGVGGRQQGPLRQVIKLIV